MNLPLQDNGQEIKKGDTHFILHGVYHGIQWVDGEPYRPRVEMLVIKDGRQVFLRKYDEKQGHGYNYRLPGGSLDSDSDRLTQALNETNEEALLDVSNPYFTGVQYFRNYEEGFLLKGGDICIAYKGEVTEVFTSKYIGKYDKKSVDKEDLDNDMAKNGKFYYITSVMQDMSPEHLDALLQSTEVDDDIKRQIRLRTSVIESAKVVVVESDQPKKKPVYLVSCGYNTGFSNAVKAYTKSQYNHSALALDDKLDTMYTFRHPHMENGKFTGGFEVENLKYIMRLDKNAIIKVNVVMVEEDKFEELQRNINKLISNMRDTKYDTANLLRTFLQIEIDDSQVKDDTLTCAEFVAKMLYNLGIKISDKPLNLITPDDIANSEIAYHSTRVYMGSAKGYKPSKLTNMPTTESFVLEVKRSELPDHVFGIPEERKYPLDTKEHVLSAIKLFNHVEPKYEKDLAKRIKSAINEFDIQADEIHMTEKNRLSKYMTKRWLGLESMEFTMETNMPKDELMSKIEKLIKANNKDVATFGREAKLALLNGFGNMNDLFIAFNTVLFIGGLALALCIPIMVTILITYISVIPYGTVTSLLLKQKKLIDSNIKKLDRNGKTYKSIVDKVIESNGELKSMMESYTIVMEAPADDDINEEESTDYTAEVDDADMDDMGDDFDEEESTDYTEEVEDEEFDEEETDDETTEEDETEEETEDETETEEFEEEESTDYTEEVDDTDMGDDMSEDTTDTDMDTSDTEETVEDSDTNKNTIIKNYNLMVDFQKMFRAISDILVNLEPVIYTQPIQNSVLAQVIKNLRTIKDYVVRYVDVNFSDKYEENLYYYGIFLQAMKFNLEILRKNDELDNDN